MNKSLGQYFTVSDTLQQIVHDWVQHKNQTLLEPSFGAGHLLQKFLESNPNYPMHCCEIDNTIKPVVNFLMSRALFMATFWPAILASKNTKRLLEIRLM